MSHKGVTMEKEDGARVVQPDLISNAFFLAYS